MNTVAQIPYNIDNEDLAAEAVATALVTLGMPARASFMGFGTPVIVPIGDTINYKFQGWADEDGWFAGRDWFDNVTDMWQPDESEDAVFVLPALKGVTDIAVIAQAIYDAVTARHYGAE